MRSVGRLLIPSTILLFTLLAGPQIAAQNSAHYNGLAATGFTQCYSSFSCTSLDSCQLDELVLAGDCNVNCYDEIPGGGIDPMAAFACQCSVYGQIAWEIEGSSGYIVNGHPFPTISKVLGNRESADSFRVRGFVQRFDDHSPALPTEFAVFRFDGDPSAFDGLEAESVYDLVADGLIENSDVLWVGVYAGPDEEFDELVDVPGIPDEEIVVFVASSGSFPIPAVTTWGAILLVVLILALTPLALRRRGQVSTLYKADRAR